ncbi:uncharacterized protein RSE6_08800 [Rhynchosporium secalis]|uniref:Uncharacterized protein n=1 Tax=Rhynchosporium secalis TaxID=38038 RepID=A0A1E1MGC4_RHYSE|nr:uncharacterized protein RSE6_08800 [Rhynchosporium secalis]
MDILQEYLPTIMHTLYTLEPYTRLPLRTLNSLYTQATPLLTPYISSLLNTLHASPAILSLAAIILLLVLALQILSFIRRVMMFWFRLVMRLVFWAVLGLAVAVVWQRGVGRTMEDLWMWGNEVRRVWEGEYKRWEGYQNQGQNSGGSSGRGGAYAGRRTNAASAWR